MENWLVWALVLFAVGMAITALEVLIPSGGLLALVVLGCLVGSLACAYQHSGLAMVILAAVEVVCVPTMVIVAFKILPRTSIGRQLFLRPPGQRGAPQSSSPVSGEADDHAELLGADGVVVTALRPSGTAEFNGRRISVVSNGEAIGEGRRVRVALIEGNRIVVEPLAE